MPSMQANQRSVSGRLKRLLFFGGGIVLSVAAILNCMSPAAFKSVGETREGIALLDRICVVYGSRYQINLGGLEKLHPFDINKYAKIYLSLVAEGLIRPEDVFVPEPVSREQLLTVHTPEYLGDLKRSAKLAEYLEFGPAAIAPAGLTDAAVLSAFRHASGGTLLACRLALKYSMAINLGGGYHHAEPDRGGGFCIYADMPIAIRILQAEGAIERALIVDLDVHQGNGTAECVAEDDRVYTFDMHESDIYPIPKAQNDWDIPLPAGTGDEEYLDVLSKNLPLAFERARPDIVVFQSGVDGLKGDPLANFELSASGLIRRDQMVFAEAARRGIPIVMVLGGGYSKGAWRVQFESIKSLLEAYGLEPGERQAVPRQPTLKEKPYGK